MRNEISTLHAHSNKDGLSELEGVEGLAEEAGVLPVGHAAAGRTHGLRQDHVGRQFVAAPFQKLQRAARVRRIDSAREQAPRLHHLMAGIMHRRRCVVAGSYQRKFVREFRVQRKNL